MAVGFSDIVTMLEILKGVYEQVEKTKQLKPLAESLAERARNVEAILKNGALKIRAEINREEGLVRILNTIQRILKDDFPKYLKKLQGQNARTRVRCFLNAGDYIEERDRLVQELDSAMNELNIAFGSIIWVKQEQMADEAHGFNRSIQVELKELQAFAAKILTNTEEQLEEQSIEHNEIEEIKAKLDKLQSLASERHPNEILPTVQVIVLAKGAKAGKVEHETIGFQGGDFTFNESAKSNAVELAQNIRERNDAAVAKLAKENPVNIQVTVLEAEAYADLVIERTMAVRAGDTTMLSNNPNSFQYGSHSSSSSSSSGSVLTNDESKATGKEEGEKEGSFNPKK